MCKWHLQILLLIRFLYLLKREASIYIASLFVMDKKFLDDTLRNYVGYLCRLGVNNHTPI